MDVETITPDQVLDTKGLSCPMPLLKTKKAINSLTSGQILEVMGTDPGSKMICQTGVTVPAMHFLAIKRKTVSSDSLSKKARFAAGRNIKR